VLGGIVAAAALYHHLTNADNIRRQVIRQLEGQLVGVGVRIESARLRLLGGVSLSDVRLIRTGDPDQNVLLHVPSAVIFHDKEQLLKGVLAIRKIELQRPRFRIVRSRDGKWNTANLLGPVNLDEPLPTIVVEQGTFLVEDRLGAPDLMPVEIKNVNLTLVNDPLPTLAIEARGNSDLVGGVHARAAWQRATESMTAAIETTGAAIGPPLVQRLAAYVPEAAVHARELTGVAQLQACFDHQPGGARPLSYHLRGQVSKGTLRHPQLPLPLQHLECKARCDDGRVTLESLTARNGDTYLSLKAVAEAARADADFSGEMRVEKLILGPELFAGLPESLHDIQEDYAPAGAIDLSLEFGRTNGLWKRHTVVRAADVKARVAHFPYPVEQVHGTIDQQVDEEKQTNVRRVDLTCKGGGRPIQVKGEVTGTAPDVAVNLDISSTDLPLDDALRDALPKEYQKLAGSFHITGVADFVAHIRRVPGARKCANHITIDFHDCGVSFDEFPYPLEKVAGKLTIMPDHFEFTDFHGSHKGGEFYVRGRSHPTATGDRISTEIHGKNILLDEELRDALAPRGRADSRLKAAWAALNPGGRLNVTAIIDQLPRQPEDVDVTVTARGCTLRPEFFPYPMAEVGGTVRYARDRIDVSKLTAKQGKTLLTLDEGQIFLQQAGGFYARMTNLRGNPLLPDQTFLDALPPMLARSVAALHLKDPVGLTLSELVVKMPPEPNVPPIIYWNGGVALKDASLQLGVDLEKVTGQFWCRGLHNGRQLEDVVGNALFEQATLFKQPVRDIHSHVIVEKKSPDVLRAGVTAHFFGGDVGGEARVEFGPTLHYVLNLNAMQVKLEEFGKHNLGANVQLEGMASARLYLTGQGTEVDGLEGHGRLDVPAGKIYSLPLLLDLLKVLGLRMPDRTAFEEMHAGFSIQGPRVKVDRLDLYGNAISLSGEGEMNLDGTDLQLDFYAVWGRIMQVLPPLFRPLPPAVAEKLLKIKMRGKVDDVRCTKEPVPFLVGPLERLLKRDKEKAPALDPKKPEATPLPFAGSRQAAPGTLTGRPGQ